MNQWNFLRTFFISYEFALLFSHYFFLCWKQNQQPIIDKICSSLASLAAFPTKSFFSWYTSDEHTFVLHTVSQFPFKRPIYTQFLRCHIFDNLFIFSKEHLCGDQDSLRVCISKMTDYTVCHFRLHARFKLPLSSFTSFPRKMRAGFFAFTSLCAQVQYLRFKETLCAPSPRTTSLLLR